ncbi:hypothetical protein [Streptomyces sp. MK37H]|uniref:hypothetical protein n=1 Tax=Streptomyces sp. MK37H TaxID=2699117 RepID=UPI001B3899DC|nr:hypothetical protein [Streptomyces sp. MK37H]MBP8532260.1 hypothetical protein [Streptomyces sp. MK37H]
MRVWFYPNAARHPPGLGQPAAILINPQELADLEDARIQERVGSWCYFLQLTLWDAWSLRTAV